MPDQEIISPETNNVFRYFLSGIFLSSLLIFPAIMDFSLVPRYISLALFLSLSLFQIMRNKHILRIPLDSILLFYISYTAFCCLSVFWSTTPSEAIFESTKQVLSLFVFLFTVYLLKNRCADFIKKLAGFSLLFLLSELLAIIYQLKGIDKLDKDSIYLVTGLNGHKNLLSSFLFLNLFPLLFAFRKYKKQWKVLAGAAIIVNLVVIVFLRTKAVWVGLGVTLLLAFILYAFRSYKKQIRSVLDIRMIILLICLSVNVFFFNLLQPLIRESIHHTSQSGSPGTTGNLLKLEEERLILWDKTYIMLHKHNLLGVGMGNWQIEFPDATLSGIWRAEDLNYTFQRPHNDFLWILSETGLIGFNLFLFFAVSILCMLVRIIRKTPGNKNLHFEWILCASFITGYLTLSFFDFPKERIEHTLWISLIFGMAYYHIKTNYPLRCFYTLQVKSSLKLFAFTVMCCITFTGLMRFKGEYYVRKLFDYKNSDRKMEIIKAGSRAMSYVYTIDPTSVPVSWYTGNAQAALGNYNKAQADFLLAYRYNPYNRNVLNDLASSYVYSNKPELAKIYYKEAARISPRFDDPKLNLAALYINEKDFKAADECLKTIMHDSEKRSMYQRIVDAEK